MTNETIASQLAHRTIRAYKDQPLTDAEVETLMDVARHTATSSFLQACTILHITDPQVREAIGAASGQPLRGRHEGRPVHLRRRPVSQQPHPRPTVKALELPELTFPGVGLLVGHADQEPGQKPRMPRSVTTAKNTYPRVESYTETLADYDREVTKYYDLRAGSRLESFSHLVATTIGVGGAHVSPIMEVLNEQGLCLR